MCEPAGHFGSTSFTVRLASMILISSYIPIKLLVDLHAIADFDWILAMESIVAVCSSGLSLSSLGNDLCFAEVIKLAILYHKSYLSDFDFYPEL